ncbi:MAG: hypothetical protein HZB50_18045 [Chloroflexi bacterium]|nr:hypothetical protein [Chloroflexota bacterium]
MQKTQPNITCTGRWGFCGTLRVKHFSGFGFLLLLSRVHTRPMSASADRWVAAYYGKVEER